MLNPKRNPETRAKSFNVEDFKSLLRKEVEAICSDEGLLYDKEQNRGFAFQKWCANLLAHHEGLDEDDTIEQFASNDQKIDFIAEDANEKAIYFCQTKFVSIQANPPLNEAEVSDFFSRHEIFLASQWALNHANDLLQVYISDYKYRLDNGWSIHYYFFSTGKSSPRIQDLVAEKEAIAKRENPGMNYHLLDIYGLKEYHIESQTLEAQISEQIELQFQADRVVIMSKPRKTLVATIKANALVNLYRKESREDLRIQHTFIFRKERH